MRAPLYWYSKPESPTFVARLLSPLGVLYARATQRRIAQAPEFRADIPVICVGNINAGGTGKTPTVIALLQILLERGLNPAVISRGHGGSITEPTQVDPRKHTAQDVGDEPLLAAAFAPTWVAKNRADAARAAQKGGADVIIMDDGFQNPQVAKTLSIVVVDAHRGFGNARCIPAGPLREPVEEGLKRADLVLSIGSESTQVAFAEAWASCISVPHLTGQLEPLQTGMDWEGLPVLAFAGIGHPEKFFETVRDLGANVVACDALEDHQPLSAALMSRLARQAAAVNAQLVTTEKDAVRLPKAYRHEVLTVPVRLQIKERHLLDAALSKAGL